MTPALLWLAIALQVLGALCGLLLGSTLGALGGAVCIAVALLLTVTAFHQ